MVEMNPSKHLLFALVALGLFACANAYEPMDFVANRTFLLEENEIASESITIAHENKDYYVVTVELNDQFNGFIALDKSEERIIENEDVTSKLLFRTSRFIKEYSEFKKQVESNPSQTWFLLSTNIARSIATMLEDEKNDLDIIDSQLQDAEASAQVAALKTRLDSLSGMLFGLGGKMSQTNTLETMLLKSAETGLEKDLKNSLLEVFSDLKDLDAAAVEYNAELKALQRIISSDTELDAESKKSLIGLSQMPNDFQKIGNWATGVSALEEGVNNAYENSLTESLELVKAFNRRIARGEAFGVIFAEDLDLYGKTDNQYASVKTAAEAMLSTENKPYWKDRQGIELLETNWKKAEGYFGKGDYDKAKSFGLKAKANIIDVFEQGFEPVNGTIEYRWDIAIAGGVLIIISLIIIYILKNRKKLASVVRAEEKEEVSF